jgi:two-component sensor histidine kinase
LGDLCPDVELCVSELATNAVRYGVGSLIGLSLAVAITNVSCSLLVEVFNRDGGEPIVAVPASAGEYGRGLLLVSALSAEWGHNLAFGQWRRLWCCFERPPTAPSEH